MSQVKASHILVESEQEAKSLKQQIDGGAKFEQLAAAHSKCPSGESGGDLGWFGRGMMVKPFEEACFTMKEGDVSAPVKTQFGYHLIKLTGKK
ncbi:peptidyl-prolyl cis-trans isomerase [Candidatus Sumerlaeota bacterium]|nr:peptidyl-prolyl cis-trans isomerase [Candidatus Sumerlaeota bacterium]